MIRLHESRRLFYGASFILFSLLLGACGGGGGSTTSGTSSQALTLQDISVSSGQTWQINRRIGFTFSQPIDFATVNMNTINVAQINGAPAIGSFLQDPADPRRIYFLPTCPTKADFSDAGLLPGGVHYRILVPGADSNSLTVRASNGSALASGQTLVFSTPNSTVLTQLFLDPVNGPPSALLAGQPGELGTRLVLGGDTANPVHFVRDELGVGRLPAGMLLPLNLYSQPQSRVELYVEFDQPVNPSVQNISSTRLRIQYDADPNPAVENWTPVATRVELIANCTATGSTVRLTPIGVLPQDRALRVFVSAEFEDLVGDRNILPLVDFARMTSNYFQDGLGFPLSFTDEFREDFVLNGNQVGSVEDTTAVFDGPSAKWSGGRLSAAFGFSGTGGPGGNFDLHILPNTDFILDTTATLVTGGPGGLPVTQQLVIGGRLDVRNLSIPATSTLRIQGPNPALILCSGSVDLRGKIVVNGNPGRSVFTVSTPTLPEIGASGQAGGGRGGTGSFITTGPTPRGGTGFGAFNVEGLGGEGGESGFTTNGGSNGVLRKVAGGGGGSFGHDQILAATCASNPAVPARDQTLVGLDAEDGFPGVSTSTSAVRNEPMPWGGRFGPRPFFNPTNSAAERADDFYGIKIAGFNTPQATLMVGELPTPWAGAGGGAGGDSIISSVYPPPTFVFTQHQKGAGAGGGAGSLHIQALGPIVFASTGRIEARGGPGGRGEAVNWQWSVGGGSGGGSGGHIIIQTASVLNLSQLTPGTVAIVARGGQGGAGPDNQGGASELGERPPTLDSIHNGGATDNPFSVNACPASQPFVQTAGGDGGPGIIQIHVSNITTDIIYPAGGVNSLGGLIKPAPLGYNWTGTTGSWVDHLLPEFGSVSRAQSKWIPLGELTVAPGTLVPDPISFAFQGTNPTTGKIEATGQNVQPLPPILAPGADVGDPGLPTIDPQDPRTLRMSAADLSPTNAFYRQNPALMKRFELVVGGQSFEVQTASYTSATDSFALTVGSDLPNAGMALVRPRYFLVETNGEESLLPTSSSIQVQFQAVPASAAGLPDTSNIFPGNGQWANDINALTNAPPLVNTQFRFFRFRVSFDIGSDLNFDTPRPSLDFLRVPFRF
jgi:hypothetical protein